MLLLPNLNSHIDLHVNNSSILGMRACTRAAVHDKVCTSLQNYTLEYMNIYDTKVYRDV